MRKVSLVIVGALLGATAMTLIQQQGLFDRAWAAANSETYRNLNLFGDVFERVRSDYVEEPEDAKLVESAIQGMLSSLDPHSTYMDAKRYRDRQVDIRGEFGGLGIEVSMESNQLKVVSPIDETPAARAGILANDIITHIDGEPIEGLSLQQAVDKMRGPVKTPIELKISRQGIADPIDMKIVRDLIKIRVVRHRVEGEDVGYIRVASFSEQTSEGLKSAIQDLMSKIPGDRMKGFVLDLRNNPGGLLDQSIQVTDAFLDRGEVVSTRGRKTEDIQRYNARSGDVSSGQPLVILINGGSASASEIVAGALQDHKRATVVGTRSFGKGSVQTLITMGQNGALSLTTARYYTPCGRSIQATGIEPDILIEPVVPEELKGRDRMAGEAGLRGHLLSQAEREAAEKEAREKDAASQGAPAGEASQQSEGGSSAYVPPEAKDDVQLQLALALLRGEKEDPKFPPKAGELSAECAQTAKKSANAPSGSPARN